MLGARGKENKNHAKIRKIIFVVTAEIELVQIRPLLGCDSTKAWTIVCGTFQAFPSRPFNVIVVNSDNVKLSVTKHQQTATGFLPASAIIRNKYYKSSRTSGIQRYRRVSILFTIRLTLTNFSWWIRWTMSRKRIIQRSLKTGEMRSLSPTSARNAEKSSYNYCPSSKSCRMHVLVESRQQNVESS